MKKIIIIYFIAAILLLPSCSSKQIAKQSEKSESIPYSAVIIETDDEINSVISPVTYTEEQQKQIYLDYLKTAIEKEQIDSNDYSVIHSFEDETGYRYYAFFDINGDGSLEMLTGSFYDHLNEYVILSLFCLNDGKVNQVNSILYDEDQEADCYPVMYDNGYIRCGGHGEKSDNYRYWRMENDDFVIAVYLKNSRESGLCSIDILNDEGKYEGSDISFDEYKQKRSELETEPLNSKLEWHSWSELI